MNGSAPSGRTHGIESARPSCPEGELTAPGVSDKIKAKADTLPISGLYQRSVKKMKKLFSKELIVLWVSLAALVFAALSLNSSLNQFADMD